MADPRVVKVHDVRTLRGSGRNGRRPIVELPADVMRIDRGSPWGNQYKIGDPFPRKLCEAEPSLYGLKMNRADVLVLYRAWLKRKLMAEPAYLEPLRGKRLACWCAPLACHGDVILEVLDLGVLDWLAAA